MLKSYDCGLVYIVHLAFVFWQLYLGLIKVEFACEDYHNEQNVQES